MVMRPTTQPGTPCDWKPMNIAQIPTQKHDNSAPTNTAHALPSQDDRSSATQLRHIGSAARAPRTGWNCFSTWSLCWPSPSSRTSSRTISRPTVPSRLAFCLCRSGRLGGATVCLRIISNSTLPPSASPLFAAMLLALALAVTVYDALGSTSTAFAVTYLALRVLLVALYVGPGRPGRTAA